MKHGRRCLVVADGYYEWHTEDGVKQPHRIHLPDEPVFCFAWLWPHNDSLDITGRTILTGDAAPQITHLHPRMPLILKPDAYARWLDPDTGADDAVDMALDNLGNQLTVYRVSRDVGKVTNNHAGLMDPL